MREFVTLLLILAGLFALVSLALRPGSGDGSDGQAAADTMAVAVLCGVVGMLWIVWAN